MTAVDAVEAKSEFARIWCSLGLPDEALDLRIPCTWTARKLLAAEPESDNTRRFQVAWTAAECVAQAYERDKLQAFKVFISGGEPDVPFGPCSCCWGMRTSRRRPSTPMWRASASRRCTPSTIRAAEAPRTEWRLMKAQCCRVAVMIWKLPKKTVRRSQVKPSMA